MHQYPDFNNRSAVLGRKRLACVRWIDPTDRRRVDHRIRVVCPSVFLMPTPPSETELIWTTGAAYSDPMHPSERLFALA
jgi:hypothetical protein